MCEVVCAMLENSHGRVTSAAVKSLQHEAGNQIVHQMCLMVLVTLCFLEHEEQPHTGTLVVGSAEMQMFPCSL